MWNFNFKFYLCCTHRKQTVCVRIILRHAAYSASPDHLLASWLGGPHSLMTRCRWPYKESVRLSAGDWLAVASRPAKYQKKIYQKSVNLAAFGPWFAPMHGLLWPLVTMWKASVASSVVLVASRYVSSQ